MLYFRIGDGTRLGNWMFQYAAAISQHDEVTCYVVKPEMLPKIRQVEYFKDLKFTTERPKDCEAWAEGKYGFRPIIRQEPARDFLLSGFFQTAKYFDPAVVRDAYRISPARETWLRETYGEWLARPKVTSVSVRRGDYLGLPYKHPFVGTKYLREAIARIPECDDFIVCSDDIPWCRRFFPRAFPKKRFRFSECRTALDDLYLASLCQNNIISNSSFHWWGAWLNAHPGKRVIAPSQWFGYVSGPPENWKDIYFEGMEILDNGYSIPRYIYAWLYLRWNNFKMWSYPLRKRLGKRFVGNG